MIRHAVSRLFGEPVAQRLLGPEPRNVVLLLDFGQPGETGSRFRDRPDLASVLGGDDGADRAAPSRPLTPALAARQADGS